MKQKNYYQSILLFGFLLAALVGFLKFFQYKYYIGSLNTEVYTSVVAVLFTIIGVWLGATIIKQKKATNTNTKSIDHKKIEALKLNGREYEILTLIAKGHSNQEIAQKLFIALPTVKTHTSNLYTKLSVKSRTQAIYKAQSLNLI